MPVIEDARSKIIQKNRAKIRDVRDLISAKKKPADARYVITKNMTERLGKMGHAAVAASAMPRRAPRPAAPAFTADRYMLDALALDDLIPMQYDHHHRQSVKQSQYAPLHNHNKQMQPHRFQPVGGDYDEEEHYHKYHYHRDMDLMDVAPRRRSYVDYDAVVDEDTQPMHRRDVPEFDMLFKEYMSTKQGGGGSAPAPPPPSSGARYTKAPLDEDVFDLYEAPARDRRPLPPPPTSSLNRRFVPTEESHLSHEMRSRLEGSQSAPKSMGIFANPPKPSTSSSTTKGYRVMVTNLHSSVTVWDIQELFADIGGLASAEIVKPGVAEVVYKTMKDAEDAVEVYHNRQLDGQPMKCHLITPPAPPAMQPLNHHHHSSSSSSSMMRHHSGGGGFSSSSGNSRKPPLELDLDTLHSALFTNKKRH